MSGRLAWSGAVSVLVWLAAGAAVAHGVLHGLGQRADVPLPAPPVAAWQVDTGVVAKALGAQANSSSTPVAAEPVGQARYALLGVVAPAAVGLESGPASSSGVALIAVDGQRALPYRVGAVLDGRWQVQSVQRRAVVLAATNGANGDTSTTQTQTLRVPEPGAVTGR
jgi:general secretion pathway protein C